jgi:hypothetical protein
MVIKAFLQRKTSKGDTNLEINKKADLIMTVSVMGVFI